jgi:hypothetical protein
VLSCEPCPAPALALLLRSEPPHNTRQNPASWLCAAPADKAASSLIKGLRGPVKIVAAVTSHYCYPNPRFCWRGACSWLLPKERNAIPSPYILAPNVLHCWTPMILSRHSHFFAPSPVFDSSRQVIPRRSASDFTPCCWPFSCGLQSLSSSFLDVAS